MTTTTIRQKLHRYIETAQDKKIKAIFAIVEDDIEETYDHWNDDAFVAELKRRESSYIEGTSKTYSLEQIVKKTNQGLKKVKSK